MKACLLDPKLLIWIFLFQAFLLLTVLGSICLSLVLFQQADSLMLEFSKFSEKLEKCDRQVCSLHILKMGKASEEKSEDTPLQNLYTRKSFILPQHANLIRNLRRKECKKRARRETTALHQSFLQLVATDRKDLIWEEDSATIPWTVVFKGGTGVHAKENRIIVDRDGYYMVFGQVLYFNPDMPMGHLIRRMKSNVVGSDPKVTILFSCIQNMPEMHSNNSCFTAGVVKLDQGDVLDLVIVDRPEASISMDGDSTFFGIIQLL
ncbi:tumor necrosis factor ligand superfamily member 13B-like [Protopterus annectens]|uniref:tumor necrosis factor ligand superfamily member 13B-like n=1 Tax=Protopterus annectens TaxID=7888 RepID=UPI001CFA37B2|nr:tumor necrosis factor ligand superfamily member 13B-like [Protopterus annectens]